MNLPIHTIILAAGKGTRMQSDLPKVLHPVAGTAMLGHVLTTACAVGAVKHHIVYGHGGALVQQWYVNQYSGPQTEVQWALQAEQLGTGHAVLQAAAAVPDEALMVILYGDVPLISAGTVRALAEAAHDGLTVVTVQLDNPSGYGRMLRDPSGRLLGIVEENDATAAQKLINEANTGLMAGPAGLLKPWLARIKNDNKKGEYYLTDVVAFAVADGFTVNTVAAASAQEVEGVNDRMQLAQQERVFQRRAAEDLMRKGVHLIDPSRFDLRGSLTVGRDVRIDVGVVIEGACEFADGVQIGPYCVLKNVRLGVGTQVLAHSVLEGLSAGADCRIGPFSRVRPDTTFADQVHIGNFVEVKKGQLGQGAKAGHLAYLGDAVIGARVNVSAGVITCNYDGANKFVTTIEDDAFIGTDTQLIAPVTVGQGAYVAAGSTISKDVVPGSLTICRARETKTIANWQRPKKR